GLRLCRRTDGRSALRPGQRLHGANTADAADGRPYLRCLPGLLGGTPRALVSLRRHPHAVSSGSKPVDDLAAAGGLDLPHAILSARTPQQRRTRGITWL